MKIKELVSQHRRDFTALMECEFCGHQEMNNSGYDDRYYHDNVIPNMKCGKCGEVVTIERNVKHTKTK